MSTPRNKSAQATTGAAGTGTGTAPAKGAGKTYPLTPHQTARLQPELIRMAEARGAWSAIGNSIEQAFLAICREHGLDPSHLTLSSDGTMLITRGVAQAHWFNAPKMAAARA